MLLSHEGDGSQGEGLFPTVPKGESQAPPTSRTGECEEVWLSQLPFFAFLEESLSFSGPQFPLLKRALGRVVGETDGKQG